jgi:serine/threonine-protein kinase
MDQDGVILYDEDPNQVGRFLFSDAMYANFPELQKFAQEVIPEPSGVGYYSFHDPSGEHIVHKIAAWDTFKPADGIEWNVIVTYPYIVKKARY